MLEMLLNKSLEVILTVLLEKLFTWLLKDENCQRLNQFIKIQILVIYLDWVLLKTPLKSFMTKKITQSQK
jgi:hypothetical protein